MPEFLYAPRLRHAFARAREGLFRIHPLHASSKKPHLRGYKALATQRESTIQQWWRKWPNANIGGVLPQDMAVLDVDLRNGGEQTLATLLLQHALPQTVTVRTASHGSHFYFRLPIGLQLKTCTKLGAGLELLSCKSNVVLPGSVGASGYCYTYKVSPEESEVAVLPGWLIAVAGEAQRPLTQSKGRLSNGEERSRRVSLPDEIPMGTRNDTLVRLAASLRVRGHEVDDIFTFLQKANDRCRPPYPTTRLEEIAAWAGQKSMSHVSLVPRADPAVLTALEGAIQSYDWRGQFGFSCRAVADALAAFMKKLKKESVHASVRALAEDVGSSYKTVARCLQALTGRDLQHPDIPQLFECRVTSTSEQTFNSKRIRREQFPHAYSVSAKIAILTHTLQGPPPCLSEREKVPSSAPVAFFLHDAFRSRHGLSKSRAVALSVIESEKIESAAMLVEHAQKRLRLRTAQRCLTDLVREHLIEKKDGVYCRTTHSAEVHVK